MTNIASAIRNSTFLKHNAIFFFGALAAGALNYIFYPIMARLLSTNSFGEIQALFSLFAQVNIFLSVLGLITVNIVVNNEWSQKRDQLILELEKLALLTGLVVLFASFLAGPMLERFFHFNTIWPFVVLGAAVFVTIPLTFRSAYLRGKRSFGLVAILNIMAAAADLVLSVLFVVLHGKTTGVLIGLVLAQFLTFMCAAWLARRHGFSVARAKALFTLPDMRMIAPELRYALLVLVSSLIITGMYSVDTIVVKHWFDARTAGLYAGIATIARIIFFVTASIAQVLLPSVRMSRSAQHNRQVLVKSFILLTGIGGSVLLVFCLMSRRVVEILMGQRFLPYANLLPRLSLVIFFISVVNLFVLYHLALRRYAIAVIAVVGALLTTGLMLVNHQTPQAVVNDLLYGSVSVGVMLGVWSMSIKASEVVLVPEQSETQS
jgi:O-antigen/teichoic acid export membrane protein